ncbi:MAG TPA: hypothetical protein DEQ20_10445 [Desulfobulbaceae bacterium]|nr:hypothetical protein [Desulfobulbaceae bacterium]
MTRPGSPTEFDVLAIFVDEMELQGVSRKLIRLSIDEAFVGRLNAKLGVSTSIEPLQKLTDRCLANEWLEHTILGAGKYGVLSITATGLGVVRSKQKSEEVKRSRSNLKKVSDAIEDHKGLFIATGALLALAGVSLKLFLG